jgi:hypothetical protein
MAADRRKTSQPPQFVLTLAAMLLALLAVVSGMVGMVHQAAELGPRVGDLVAFDPAHRAAFTSDARLTAFRPQQTACVLDLSTIQKSGGSLVLERRGSGPERLYHAHWSGLRTSRDADDCGSQADLVLSRNDIDTLAAAAGGFGVDHTSVLLLR